MTYLVAALVLSALVQLAVRLHEPPPPYWPLCSQCRLLPAQPREP